MNKNDRVRLRCRPLSSLDEDLKGVGLKCVPGRCHCHLYGNDQGPSLHNPDWTPHMEAMLKVMPAERPFHKALVLLDKQLSRVRAATGKFIKQNALAARVIPRALQPLEIGELDPVMLGVGLGIARLAAPLEALLNFPLLALPLGIAEGRRTKMGGKPGLHMERLEAMKEEVDLRSLLPNSDDFNRLTEQKTPPVKVPFEQILNPPHPYPGKVPMTPMDLISDDNAVPAPVLTKEEQAKRYQAQHEAIIANARAAEKEEQERQRAAAEKEEELTRQLAAEAQEKLPGAGNAQLPWQVSQRETKESAPPSAPPSPPLERAAPTVNELEASSSSRRARRAPSS